MHMNKYKFPYDGNDKHLKYFADNPCSNWSFQNFTNTFNSEKPSKTKIKPLLACYLNALNTVERNHKVPNDVKHHIRNLIDEEKTDKKSSSSIEYNIVATGSSKIYAIGDKNTVYAETSQPPLEEEESDDERIPSDLSIDHHPHRTAEYFFINEEPMQQKQEQQQQEEVVHWLVNEGYNISEKCYALKRNTQQMKRNPGSLSDLRLLALNDIFIFSNALSSSVTKYFGTNIHQAIMSSLRFENYRPETPNKALIWCQEINEDPPSNFLSCLSVCSRHMAEAAEKKNNIDAHTAHVLTQILPLLIAGSPDRSIEDSYVHHFLAPLLQSVFSSDTRLKTRWANGNDLSNNEPKAYKPDFVVYSMTINVKCVVLIAEFKPTEQNSTIESDSVKLARQMRTIYNDLVLNGVECPLVCGILAEGRHLKTFVMDMISPKLMYAFALTSCI
ncbi:hypothetical protein RMATCC62417_01290 [Rhizopus microsporus]|nr:hypothetical protein RMATCC62417_01290 [Rhizopus microsporus]